MVGAAVSIRQRVSDYFRERRIARLSDELQSLSEVSDYLHKQRAELWARMAKEIKSRSDDQVERLERARGLRT